MTGVVRLEHLRLGRDFAAGNLGIEFEEAHDRVAAVESSKAIYSHKLLKTDCK